jgi:hypothetical protein
MAAQFASPSEQVSQWFASLGIGPAQGFMPIVTGFTPTQPESVLVTDTLVSRSLAATFSEITGHPTPLELQVPITTATAPVTETTETLPSYVASLEPPPIVTPTLEASATEASAIETETIVAPLPTKTSSEPQGQAIVLASTSQLVDPVTETME